MSPRRAAWCSETVKTQVYAASMKAKYRLTELSDEALLVNLKRCVGSENEITALVLAHLAEIDARGAYRQWACATLVSYCVYELRLSEDEAQRRCRAARVARQFPILFEMLAEASIHLTGIVLLAPHLTQENHVELLARARYRTKRELEKLIAQIAPRADVPNVIEPLGPADDEFRRPAPSTYSSMVYGVAGYVRQLTPGDEPTEAPSAPPRWLEASAAGEGVDSRSVEAASAPALPVPDVSAATAQRIAPDPDVASAPARIASMRYKVQFTADQTYVDLLEQARDLLEHQIPNRDLAAVQRLAIQALVEALTRRKYGESDTGAGRGPRLSENAPAESTNAATSFERTRSEATPSEATPSEATPSETTPSETTPPVDSAPCSAGRHLPAALRRSVAQRDGGRCTYVDSRGVRCRETARLEFHHVHAHARGGPTSVDNITLRCRAHNDLAAEHDFGRRFMERRKRREPPLTSDAPAQNGETP